MPTYAYRGTACTHEFDVFQKFSDASLTDCPECGGPIRRVFQPVGVVFKGSGWYINDSRSKATTAPASPETKSSEGKSGEDKSTAATAATPATKSDKKETSSKTANASTG